jgi:hypothetical protein
MKWNFSQPEVSVQCLDVVVKDVAGLVQDCKFLGLLDFLVACYQTAVGSKRYYKRKVNSTVSVVSS